MFFYGSILQKLMPVNFAVGRPINRRDKQDPVRKFIFLRKFDITNAEIKSYVFVMKRLLSTRVHPLVTIFQGPDFVNSTKISHKQKSPLLLKICATIFTAVIPPIRRLWLWNLPFNCNSIQKWSKKVWFQQWVIVLLPSEGEQPITCLTISLTINIGILLTVFDINYKPCEQS